MRRVFLPLLAVVTLYFSLTFAGMAVFGMGGRMIMNHAGGMDCVTHCLSMIPASTVAMPPISAAGATLFSLFTIFVILAARIACEHLAPTFRRLREGIGKSLLTRRLSTVILRN